MAIAVRFWVHADKKTSRKNNNKKKKKEKKHVTMCIGFKLLAESMEGAAIAFELNGMIRAIGLDVEDVVCAARDRASPDSVAIETMQAAYKNMLDVNCISHTLNDVGTNIKASSPCILPHFHSRALGIGAVVCWLFHCPLGLAGVGAFRRYAIYVGRWRHGRA
jgi:hypothetical protein